MVLTLLAVVLGFLRAHHLRWVCDDAFITFRYIENWIAGNGLVYNAGERVEGYTHFLWLCLVALGQRLGGDPVLASEVLGLAAWVLTIGLCALATCLISGSGWAIPFAALALALHYDYAIWATGGLETSLFTCEILAAFLLLGMRGRTGVKRLVSAGFILALAVLTRPDGAILWAAALAWAALEGGLRDSTWRLRIRPALLFLAPGLLILLPYGLWKHAYYGHLLPNTYFAKSAGSAYFSQGFRYLWVYFRAYLSSLLFLLAIPVLLRVGLRGRGPGWKQTGARVLADSSGRPLLLGLFWISSYLVLFVARVGGDFMYARFLIPVVPLLYLTAEIALRQILSRWKRVLVLALLLLPLLLPAEKTLRDSLFFDRQGNAKSASGPYDISDEHWYYMHEDQGMSLSRALREMGQQLRPYFEGTKVRVLLRGQATMGYYAHFFYCLDESGLTDPVIARLRLEKRGRPGHEKTAPMDYLVRRGVHLLFLKKAYREDPYRFVYFQFGSRTVRAEMFTYDRALLAQLRERLGAKIRFTDFPAYLDDWLRDLRQRPKETVRLEYAKFHDFYFLGNPDPAREGVIQAYLNEKGGS